jgi:transposase
MQRLQELVRLHRMGTRCREVARLLKMGPAAELAYRQILEAAGLLLGSPDELPPLDVLRCAVEAAKPPKQGHQEQSTAQPWAVEIETLTAKGVGPKAIYDRLRRETEGFTASYDAVKRMAGRVTVARGVQPEDVAIPVVTLPGQVAQVDFGEIQRLYDPPRTGVLRRAWVFVMVLGHSRHQFCRVVFDQRMETWQRLHAEAFEYFGGVPETLVPDNLKAAVIRAAFSPSDNTELNRSYRELAKHYGFKIDPAPPKAPKKKGKVERGVQYVKRNFFKGHDFADIDEANRLLDEWVIKTAGERKHGTTGRKPLVAFDEDRAALRPLPVAPFVPVTWKQATVHQDCQLVFDGRPYPAPWRTVGKRVWVRATPATLDVYLDDQRLISHARGVTAPREIYDQCLPPKRAELRHRSHAFWEERADAIAPEVGAYVREVFSQDDVLSLLRRVQSMVGYLEQFPVERARAACLRAQYFGNYTYSALKDILRKGLDLEPLPNVVLPSFGALASPRYARDPRQLLNLLPLEKTHEPN